MTFSVVIPLYNKEQYVVDTINSVLNQTFNDYEVIVVDDGSTDHSKDRVKTIQSSRLKCIFQDNQGVAVARNTGIENANGDYIAFLDADDYWHPDYLETIYSLINRYPESDMYVSAYRVVLENGKVRYSKTLNNEDTLIKSYWMTYKNVYDTVWTSATVIKQSAIYRAGMFTPGEEIGEDLDLWARVAKNNPLVAYSPKVRVDYRRNAAENARRRVKIAYPKALLNLLKAEMVSPKWSDAEKFWMRKKYNRKMCIYVFTTILAGEKRIARIILKEWKKDNNNQYILPLYISSLLPNNINKVVYNLRLKVF
jgi:glycosyltransferase involved in cell wall biosynthesis